MKKLFFAVTFVAVILALPSFVSAQEVKPLTTVLNDYYGVKDALVAGDGKAAAAKAGELMKAAGDVDMKALSAKEHTAFMGVREKLIFDARHISESTSLDHQREHFGALSANMMSLAKQAELSEAPVYADYCPMKKTYWLSNAAEIKNPYYGSTMLTCGKVTATFKP